MLCRHVNCWGRVVRRVDVGRLLCRFYVVEQNGWRTSNGNRRKNDAGRFTESEEPRWDHFDWESTEVISVRKSVMLSGLLNALGNDNAIQCNQPSTTQLYGRQRRFSRITICGLRFRGSFGGGCLCCYNTNSLRCDWIWAATRNSQELSYC